MTARDVMFRRLRGRNLETALERDFYCSPDDYQVDLDMIWYRDWLFVGHDCEVLNPGNYITVQIGEYPVLVVRDRDGALRGFHNSCRHGGSARLSVPSVDLSAGRPLILGARYGKQFRSIEIWAQARALCECRRLYF